MELTCEDPGALSAPSCRLTRFREFVPNDRIWIYPCFCQELLRPGNNTQIATNPGDSPWTEIRPRAKRAWPGAIAQKRGQSETAVSTVPAAHQRIGLSWDPRSRCALLLKKMRDMALAPDGAQDLNRPVLHAAGDTFTRTAFLVMSRGDQFFFAEAVVSITGREKSDASNLGFI